MEDKKIGVLTQRDYLNNGLQTFESNVVPWLLEQDNFEPIYYKVDDSYPLSRTLQPLINKYKIKEQAEGFDVIFVPAQNLLTFNPEEVDAEVVTYVHDVFPYVSEYREDRTPILKPVIDFIKKLTGSEYLPHLVKSDTLLTASRLSKKDLEYRTSFDGNVRTVYQGVNDKPEVEERQKDIDLLYVGSVELGRKNPDFVKEVFEDLHEQGYKVASVNFNGTGLKGEEYVNLTDQELANLYSRSRFYLHASYMEGFGRGAVEAQRYGCIPLALNNDINHEVLGSHNESWISVNSKDGVYVWVEGTAPEKIRREAKKNASRFEWSKTRRQIKDFLETC